MPLNHLSKYTELTDKQFILIGKLTIEFSNVEFLLSKILSRLLITPSFLSRTYTERMNVSSILEKIKKAINIHSNRYGHKIISKQLCERLTQLEKFLSTNNKSSFIRHLVIK